ncbi:MAG: error-prone DNA polymerase, partial [Planctomycetes bacterium]|nr:error-prone DNA polymerase [Planctomycetota bacterium]
AFTCALLNSLPMGFYGPSQLVSDARKHGVEVRPVDVTRSVFDAQLETDGRPELHDVSDHPDFDPERYGEGGAALRLGLRSIKGFSSHTAEQLVNTRRQRPFESVEDCVRRAGLDRRQAATLAEAGAFGALTKNRRQAWWQAGTRLESAPLFATEDLVEAPPELAEPGASERLRADFNHLGLSLEMHPMELLRAEMKKRGILDAADLAAAPQGLVCTVAGISICRQRPATASGVMFITLEDEHGFINCVLRKREQERFRPALLGGNLLVFRGVVERTGDVVHLLVRWVDDCSGQLRSLKTRSRDFH